MNAVPAGPYPPTAPLVAVAWLGARVAGITDDQVATSLPKDAASWADAGFIQVTLVPGGVDVDVPQRRTSVVQLDFWAVKVDAAGNISNKPPWNKANRLAELTRIATEDAQTGHYGKPVTMPDGYEGARVFAAYLISEPSIVRDDPSGYARLTADLAVDWARIP